MSCRVMARTKTCAFASCFRAEISQGFGAEDRKAVRFSVEWVPAQDCSRFAQSVSPENNHRDQREDLIACLLRGTTRRDRPLEFRNRRFELWFLILCQDRADPVHGLTAHF